MWNNVVNAWWPLVFYPATDAPRFTKGMWAMIGVAIATLGVTWLVWFLEKREKQRTVTKGEGDVEEENSKTHETQIDEKRKSESEDGH